MLQLAMLGIFLLASSVSAGLAVDDSLNRYSLYGRKIMTMESGASTSQGGWIGSDSLVQIDAADTLRSTVTSGKDFQVNNSGDWIWGDVRVANDLGGVAMYNDSIMGTTYVGRNLIMAQLNILKGRVYTGGQLTVAAWNHNYFNGSDFFNNSVSTAFSSPASIPGLTWGVQPQATPYSAWTFPDTTFSASSVSIATSFTTPKDASGKYRWTCGSNAMAGGSDLVVLHICKTNDTILPPGNYGDVNLWYGSTLFLGEGTYAFRNVTLPPSSGTDSTRLLAHQPNGLQTVILVKGKLDAQASSRLNVIAPEDYLKGYGTDAAHFPGGSLMIYAAQAVSLNEGLELWASLVVPDRSVALNGQVHLFGQILADSILVKKTFKGADGAFIPYHPGQKITFAEVAAQGFGTTPTLVATSTSMLAVSFTSSTTSVCNITSAGLLSFVATGTCTINAEQAGSASYAAAATVTRSFEVEAVAPDAPVIGSATAGDGSASISFTAPAFSGGAAITGYCVASAPGGLTKTGKTSPITVTGLANGTAYTFTVTATNGAGTSLASAASGSVTPMAPQSIAFGALDSRVYGTGFVKLTAAASSGLPVSYASANPAVVRISNDTAYLLAADTVTITASQAGSASFEAAASISRRMAINKKNLTITGVTALDKVYDGTTSATVSGGTLDGAVDGDDVSLVLGTGAFLDRNVGSGKIVALKGSTLSGADAGNYMMIPIAFFGGIGYVTQADVSASITAAPLTITASDAVIAYGASDPTFSAKITGLVSGETDTVVKGLSFVRDPGAAAKDYAIVPSGATAANYAITYANGKLTIQSPPTGISPRIAVPVSHGLDAIVPSAFATASLSHGQGVLGLSVPGCREDNSCLSVDVLLPQSGRIDVGIYDNLGVRVIGWSTAVGVTDLARLPVTADGRRVVHLDWNLRSGSGRAVPEGVYLWKVSARLVDGSKLENVFKLGVKK